ncbi:GNAT family N-acetyltransferase [Paenisporosarcina sp. NPDC076898]|uniref:GNAT family N-acetyltransferase n=1 Tax=unclassified Paenisporosarcina TaxID=2642018 RepID=UPI003CFEF457
MFNGTKIRLTAMRKEDLPTYRQWNSLESFGRYYNASPMREESEKNAEQLLEHSDRSFRFAVRPIDSEQFLGVCAIEDILWPHRVGWLSIALGPEFHGKGFGTEAMQLLTIYGFNELNLHRLQLTVFGYNEGAIKLYESLGFKHEGTFREFLQRDGKRQDMHLYGLLVSEVE